MPKLFQTLFRGGSKPSSEISRYDLSAYIQQVLNNPLGVYGSSYTTTRDGKPVEEIANQFTGYVQQGYKSNGVLFAIILARLMLFSEARFQYRRLINGRPGDQFGAENGELDLLAHPWPNGTTGELLGRMEQDVSLAGNTYIVNEGDRLRRLRPDWVSIVLSADPVETADVDVVGYVYRPGGYGDPVAYLPDEIAHWSPIPDPEAFYRGMSWVTPVIRELQADDAATRHKDAFFRNGAKPGLVVSLKDSVREEQFKRFVRTMNETHQGSDAAYKTLYLAGGADVTVAGANMQQLDFKGTIGSGETRLCAAGGVPPIIVGLSEGLASATYSNYSMARRKFGDHWARPQWRSACAALSNIIEVPDSAELWYDDRDIAFLREDQKDAAEIQSTRAGTINVYITAGFTPESAVAAVVNDDETLLVHSGMVSVQLQPPGGGVPEGGAAPADVPPPLDGPATDEDTSALVDAMAELDTAARAWSGGQAQLHPRGPGGKFRSTKDKLVESLSATKAGGGGADPFEMFSREQLNRVAKARGVDVKKGAGKKDISAALLDSLHGGANPSGLMGADGSNLHGVKKPAAKAAAPKPAEHKPAAPKPEMPKKPEPAPAEPAQAPGLADLVNSPVTGRQSLAPGSVGVVERVSHADGDEFHKVNQDFDGRTAEESTDAEELAALIGGAMNLPIPRVHRVGPAELHTDWTEGVTGYEYAAEHGDDALQELTGTDTGRLMGLFDMIVGNSDRHEGNFMVTNDGRIVGIDHGFAWAGSTSEDTTDSESFIRELSDSGGSQFNDYIGSGGRNILTGEESGPLEFSFISPADVAEIRTRFEALRPDFERLGRGAWLDHSLQVVDALHPHAAGTGSIFQ